MNGLAIFEYESKEVRVLVRDEQPWWVLLDLCRVFEIGNPSDVATRLDDDEKGIDTIDTLGGKQKVVVVNESGLYEAIFTSRKPGAKQFKKWVKTVVLPSIRKTGKYESPTVAVATQQETPPLKKLLKSLVKPESFTLKRMAALLGGKAEVKTGAGRIDVLTPTEVIEVERLSSWLYQVVEYGREYPMARSVCIFLFQKQKLMVVKSD